MSLKYFTTANKEKYGKCRCCLQEGVHRDMMVEYRENGEQEIYFNMIMECFNLYLSTTPGLTTLICGPCTQQVRQASRFRAMVSSSEQQLLNCIGNKETIFVTVPAAPIHEDIDIKPDTEVKIEPLENEEDDFCDPAPGLPNDAPEEPLEEEVPGAAALLARFGGRPPPLPSRGSLRARYPAFVAQLDYLRYRKVDSKAVAKLLEETESTKAQGIAFNRVSEKNALIANAMTLLENSNLTPFKSRLRHGFPCFYCRKALDNLEKLKEHQIKTHKEKDLRRILAVYGSENLVVYVDVTDLKCSVCNQDMPNLNELKTHLINVHKKVYYPQMTDRLIPFKISDTRVFQCQHCWFNFETFGAVERHMNSHYRNYVCKGCGSGFVTKYRLKVHIKSMHVSGNYTCDKETCKKVFQTLTKLKNHVATVHNQVKRFKCPNCPERFTEYFTRQKHMVSAHGVAPLRYQCNVCDRAFDRKYNLTRHMKRDHLEERDFQCEICSYKCFTKNELIVHTIKHNGERIFECEVCKKSYARKKTLKEHMRIHNNDRRFTCDVCGQAFVQKCSLKGHMKTHHSEYVMNIDSKMKTEYLSGSHN